MLSSNWNPDPAEVRFIGACESYTFSRPFVDSDGEEYAEFESPTHYPTALRSYVDSDMELDE